MARGQAIVEFALIAPVLMFALLGLGEAAVLAATRYGWQDDIDTLAGWVAQHPGETWAAAWLGVDCDATPTVTTAPGGSSGLVEAAVTCHYSSRVFPGLFDGLPVRVEATAPLLVHMASGQCGSVPSLTGLTADVARHVLISSGFDPGPLGGPWIVRSQSHQPGFAVPCWTLIGAFG